MSEDSNLGLVTILQESNQKLLDENASLKLRIEELLSSNFTLSQQAAKTNSLQEQLNRLLQEEPIFYKSEEPTDNSFVESLQNKISELLNEREEYLQEASESKIYKDLVNQKDIAIANLTQQISEITSELDFLKTKYESNNPQSKSQNTDDIQIQLSQYADKISELNHQNTHLQNRNTLLSSELAQAQMQVKVLEQENEILTQASSTTGLSNKKRDIEQHVRELGNSIFRDTEHQLQDLKNRLDRLEGKIATIHTGGGDLIEQLKRENEDLQEQLDDFLENDRSAELAFALSQIHDLKKENEALKSRVSNNNKNC